MTSYKTYKLIDRLRIQLYVIYQLSFIMAVVLKENVKCFLEKFYI